MISLDQILLLEQKVESAVKKIQQLQSENDALRKNCAELTNALSAKTEQLSAFENDQNQIEDGIKKALDRLNFIENSFLKTVNSEKQNSFAQAAFVPQKTIFEQKPQNDSIRAEQKTENQPPRKTENSENPIRRDENFNDTDFVNQAAAATQILEQNYENPKETTNGGRNFKDDLFEENQTDDENFAAQPDGFSADFENEQIPNDSPDDNSDNDLGFDIF